MKKIILLAVVAVAVTSASCRKTRTCDCSTASSLVVVVNGTTTTNPTGSGYPQTTSDKITMDKQKSIDFREYGGPNGGGCYSKTTTNTYTITGGTGTVTDVQTCTIK